MVLSRIRRARGDGGVTLVIVALCMVGLLGVAAIVVDLGNARQVRREMQGGVDAASLAGAQDLPVPSNNAASRLLKQKQARKTASDYAARNLVNASAVGPDCTVQSGYTCTGSVGGVDLTITTPWNPSTGALPADPSSSNYIGYMYVQACENTVTFFARVIGQSSPRVCRSAVGRYTATAGGFDYGLVSTDPTKCAALTFAGNSDTILTSNGAVMVNSNCAAGNAQALDSSGSSWQLKFLDGSTEVPGYIGVVGGATLAPCDPLTQTTKCTETVPTTGISPFGDPLSGMTPPLKPTGTAKTCPKNGGGAITPGYFSSCDVSNGDITMEPGLYYLDGNFNMSGGNLTCVDGGGKTCAGNGILVYLNAGALTLNGNGKVSLPPWKTGCTPVFVGTCWDGLSIWQKSSTEASINGTSDFNLGSVYFPAANLKANGTGGGAQVNINGIVVASTVSISGTFDFNIRVPLNAPDITPVTDLGLER